MDELRNLKQMASHASGRFNQYEGVDFVLPQIFKEQVKEINSNTITYNKYSAIIETKGNQHGVLNIFMPNQWFYIASYFTDLFNELQKYKKYALKVTTKERLKELNGKELSETELNSIRQLDIDEASKRCLERFITDYSWWGELKRLIEVIFMYLRFCQMQIWLMLHNRSLQICVLFLQISKNL